jgi:hypothetical protein
MLRTSIEWLIGTVLIATPLLLMRNASDGQALRYVTYGVAVSLATLVASKGTLKLLPSHFTVVHHAMLETCVRLMLPMGFLLAAAIARPDLLTKSFFLYFLPFQFLTIAVGAASSIAEVNRRTIDPDRPDSQRHGNRESTKR